MARGLPSVMPTGAPHVHESLRDLLASGGRSFSFEFFPPKDDEAEAVLWASLRRLEPLAPTFVSVTYGAGGSTRDRTVRVTERIAAATTMTPVAHLTCVGATSEELRSVVGQYAAAGVRNVLALRGDPPGGPSEPWTPHPQGLDHADDLVRLVRGLGRFCVGVAAFPDVHPQTLADGGDLRREGEILAIKADAGAEFAITQFFFTADRYFRLRDEAARHGADLPIVPGIMPVTNINQLARFAALSGADVPDSVASRLEAVQDDPKAVRAAGVQIATELCQQLLDGGAPGLHFYTLNRSTATLEVYAGLRVGVLT